MRTVWESLRTVWTTEYSPAQRVWLVRGVRATRQVSQPMPSEAVATATAALLNTRRYGLVRGQEYLKVHDPWAGVQMVDGIYTGIRMG